MLDLIERVGDVLLRVVVPRVRATASVTGDCFTQYCGCYRCGTEYPSSNCYFYRDCCWTGQAGGPKVCYQCYSSVISC
jgi:hypothetical protein